MATIDERPSSTCENLMLIVNATDIAKNLAARHSYFSHRFNDPENNKIVWNEESPHNMSIRHARAKNSVFSINTPVVHIAVTVGTKCYGIIERIGASERKRYDMMYLKIRRTIADPLEGSLTTTSAAPA